MGAREILLGRSRGGEGGITPRLLSVKGDSWNLSIASPLSTRIDEIGRGGIPKNKSSSEFYYNLHLVEFWKTLTLRSMVEKSG